MVSNFAISFNYFIIILKANKILFKRLNKIKNSISITKTINYILLKSLNKIKNSISITNYKQINLSRKSQQYKEFHITFNRI